jgi:O-antigen/teichoic acid export membrane protein
MRLPNKLGQAERFKFLLNDSLVYGLGGALNKVLALFTFPLLARHFSVEQFGVIDLLNTSVVLLVTLLVFGQDSAVARFFYDDENSSRRRQVVSQSLVFQIITFAVVTPILWFNSGLIAQKFSLTTDGEQIIKLLILQAPFFVLINFSQGLLKWTFKRNHFLIISIGSAVFSLVGVVFGLALFEFDIASLFTLYLMTRVTFGLLGVYFVRQWLTWPSDFQILRAMLPFAIPFGLICMVASFLPVFERTVALNYIGAEELGLFAAGAKVALIIGLPINAFETAWGPFSLSIFKENDATRTYQLMLPIFTVFVCCIVLFLTAISEPLLALLVSDDYRGAGIVVFALSLTKAVEAIGGITGLGITLAKKSYLKLYSYLLMPLVAVVAIPLLSKNFGLAGLPIGSLIAMGAWAALETHLSQRVHPIEWKFSTPLLLIFLTIIIGAIHQIYLNSYMIRGVSLFPLLGIVLLALVAWFRIFDSAQRRSLTQFLIHKLSR